MKTRVTAALLILSVLITMLASCGKKTYAERIDNGDNTYIIIEYDKKTDRKLFEWFYNFLGVPMSCYEYIYDEDGRLIRENYHEEDLVSYITYEYDESGNVVRENEHDADGTLYGYWLRIAPFDSFGNPSKFEWYSPDGELKYYWVGEYDEKGREIKGTNYTPDGEVEAYILKEYDEDGNEISSQWYDADGNPLEE